jgi:hypothetical protein
MRRSILTIVAVTGLLLTSGGPLLAANPSAPPDVTSAYYNGNLVSIRLKLMPSHAALELIQHNKSINTIYMEFYPGQDFVPVIGTIPGKDFNALWREVEVHWSSRPGPGAPQLTSVQDILNRAHPGRYTVGLTPTDNVYRAAVVGP